MYAPGSSGPCAGTRLVAAVQGLLAVVDGARGLDELLRAMKQALAVSVAMVLQQDGRERANASPAIL